MNISSVHLPRPVSGSGLRLAVKLTPHGPANAVLVAAATHAHGPGGSDGGGGMIISAGWPVSMRDMSGSGPFGPIFHGVWQSLQPMVLTRYSPRWMTWSGARRSLDVSALSPGRVTNPPLAMNFTLGIASKTWGELTRSITDSFQCLLL